MGDFKGLTELSATSYFIKACSSWKVEESRNGNVYGIHEKWHWSFKAEGWVYDDLESSDSQAPGRLCCKHQKKCKQRSFPPWRLGKHGNVSSLRLFVCFDLFDNLNVLCTCRRVLVICRVMMDLLYDSPCFFVAIYQTQVSWRFGHPVNPTEQ